MSFLGRQRIVLFIDRPNPDIEHAFFGGQVRQARAVRRQERELLLWVAEDYLTRNWPWKFCSGNRRYQKEETEYERRDTAANTRPITTAHGCSSSSDRRAGRRKVRV